MRIAQIGFGGIGSIVAETLATDACMEYVAVAARPRQAAAVQAVLGRIPVVDTPAALLAARPELVIECASHEALVEYAVPVLDAGIALVAVSVGILAERGVRERVMAAVARSGAHLTIPAGAIGGIDAIAAAAQSGLDRVTYVTRKSPRTWKGTAAETMLDLDAVSAPSLFFDDSAERAALLFSEKANVTATLALAGIGFERTRVQFWADPAATRSIHEIEAAGPCGEFSFRLANRVAARDGRTSLQTAMSIVRAARSQQARLKI